MRREHLSSAMLSNRFACWVALLIALPFAISVWAQETNRELSGAALKDALLRGGYVLYFRHAATDFGQNDDRMSGYEDCAKQRNLTDSGRSDARAIGAEVKRLHIPVNTVLASPFCRTRETAQLIFGHATVDARVRGGPARPDDPARYAELRKLLSTPVPSGTNVAIVSHGNPFVALAGPPYLAEGEAAVIEPRDGAFRVVARIPVGAWRTLQ
jgi:phosphohistidine phosphatase SixA